MTVQINVAKQFSAYPFGRDYAQGRHNGLAFRQEHLAVALRQGGNVVVDLKGVAGMSGSFIQEAFGGLIGEFTLVDLQARLTIVSVDDPSLAAQAWEEIKEAAANQRPH